MKTQLITFRCPEALQAQFKEFAFANGTNMSQLMINYVKELTGSEGISNNNQPRNTVSLNPVAMSFDHVAELARIQVDIVKLMVTIEESGELISASEYLTSIIDDLLKVKMMILFSETMKDSDLRICNDTQTE